MSTTQVLLQEIQQLLDCDLGESALQIAELECKPRLSDKNVQPAERLSLLRAYCSCLNSLSQHKTSLRVITEFVSSPVRSQLSSDDLEDIARDIANARWRLSEYDLCLAQLRQIPKSHRTAKDLARMAKCAALIQSTDASDFYEELLKVRPNATEAYVYLNSLKNSGKRVEPDASNYHDVVSFTAARSMMLKLDYRGAAEELNRLAWRHGDNAQIRACQATCHYMLNEQRLAKTLYQKARALDPSLVHEMGTYACLLATMSNDPYPVYQLGNELLKIDQARPEGWVAIARYFLMVGQTQEALAIIWRAQTLAPDYAEAYYVEGAIQVASECMEEALEVYLKAHELGRSALTYRGVVDAYVKCGKYKEAFLCAKELAELMPRHAGSLAMVGMVLSHSPESYDKAAKLLEAALDIDKHCTDAIAALASLYVANQQIAEAIGLLEKHLPNNQTDDMYTRYADVLTLANELPKAAVNYTTALTINPDNERAKVGFARVDKLMHPNALGSEDEDEAVVGEEHAEYDHGDAEGVGEDEIGYSEPGEMEGMSSDMRDYDGGGDLGSGGGNSQFYY
ncbi:hypothetical protein BX070DRAFT_218080 [Coemansia spiralis]|nr:hypothetical protein BX070DRAFT_218080 [Coemansia spiralis]